MYSTINSCLGKTFSGKKLLEPVARGKGSATKQLTFSLWLYIRISLSTCTSTTNQQMAWLAFGKISRGDLSISVGFHAHVFSGIIVILNTSKFTYGAIFNLVWISPLVSFPQVSWGSALEFIYPMKQTMSSQAGVNIMGDIEEFTLMVASWVIKARWREIQRFLLEFKAS